MTTTKKKKDTKQLKTVFMCLLFKTLSWPWKWSNVIKTNLFVFYLLFSWCLRPVKHRWFRQGWKHISIYLLCKPSKINGHAILQRPQSDDLQGFHITQENAKMEGFCWGRKQLLANAHPSAWTHTHTQTCILVLSIPTGKSCLSCQTEV